MRILAYTLGLTAAASIAMANPPVQNHGNPHTTTVKPATTSGSTTTTTTSSGGTTTGGTKPTTTTQPPKLNPIAAKITAHPQLDSKITAMLPKGMTLNQASMGFKNQGQFIAALHVSRNLGIPFKDLRTEMVKDHKSLGQSIQTLKKSADSDDAVKTATHEADDDVKTTTTTKTTTSTTTKTTSPTTGK
ncbi:MAG TPA: hypothetical protein VEU08_08130 [Vicinamibacterales bacterium]|nr:hypothetical protein [Vicinamibacterales bacterium]